MRTELALAWLVLLAAIPASSSSSLRDSDIRQNLATRASKDCDELLIGAFNIQQFGQKKLRKAPVMSVILRIIRRYDVVLIQEVMGGIVGDLVKRLNKNSPYRYTAVESKRLGREQYVFLIRNDIGLLFDKNKDRYQFENTKATFFERPPFSIKLRSDCTDMEFVLTAIHTKPDYALDEIDQLVDVHSAIKRRWNTDNIIIMGDLNAGCDYAPIDELKSLDIRKDKKFAWLIPDTAKTNVASSRDCPYDRIIMTGGELKDRLISGSSGVFRYEKEYKLPSRLPIKSISDHYPIELGLKNTE